MRTRSVRLTLLLTLLTLAGASGAAPHDGPASAAGGPQPSAGASEDAAARLDRRIEAVTGPGSPGMAVLVARGGEIIYSRAEGVTRLEGGRPVTLETPFYIASVSKAITATALMMLADRGRLSLDSTLRSHLPELPPWAGRVTLRAMLSHTSGIPDHYDLLGGEEAAAGLDNERVVDLMKRQEELLFAPGTKWSYSNSAYVLLARVIERVSGEPLRVTLRDMIFRPLGMDSTMVDDGAVPRPEGRARGYLPADQGKGGFVPAGYDQTTTGAGGVWSTVRDLLKFARAYHGGELLKPDTLRESIAVGRLSDGRPSPFSLGWQVEDFVDGPMKGRFYVAQFGMLRGFRAVLFHVAEADLTYIMLSSCGRGPGFPSEIAGLFL